eukprot:7938317-Alexandrium_andersonii.AAC.1
MHVHHVGTIIAACIAILASYHHRHYHRHCADVESTSADILTSAPYALGAARGARGGARELRPRARLAVP